MSYFSKKFDDSTKKGNIDFLEISKDPKRLLPIPGRARSRTKFPRLGLCNMVVE